MGGRGSTSGVKAKSGGGAARGGKGGFALEKHQMKLLDEGNTNEFAHDLLKAHPDFAKEQGFDFHKAVNDYRSLIEFNDGIFTFYGKASNGLPYKYFFDTRMRPRGGKW